jgi:hypothetical protein
MATYIFQKISQEGRAEGLKPGSEEARDWFRDRASATRETPRRLLDQAPKTYTTITGADVGRMYMFMYDPKHKRTLPYYDRFPLIFMMEKYSDGFLGLNLHYLPPTYRARLMDALYSIEMNDRLRKSKKLRMSYSLLNASAKYRYFAPCVKRYLNSQIRSRYVYIPSEEWDIALMMPTERFSKKGKAAIWAESRKIIRGR